jgi:hypothetical protein
MVSTFCSGAKIIMPLIIAISSFLFSCSGDGSSATRRTGEADVPERSIEPVRAERISEEEYADAEKATGNAGLLTEPGLPFMLDRQYSYKITREGSILGEAAFNFAQDENMNYTAECRWELTAEGEKWESHASTVYTLDDNLRPLTYMRTSPDETTGESVTRSVYFTGEKFGINVQPGDEGSGESFREIPRPYGDIWPCSPDEFLDLAIIMACIDPMARHAKLWILDVEQERVSQLSLESMGEEPYISVEDATTMMLRRYETAIDGGKFAALFVSPDGKLIAADMPGGIHAELKIIAGE